ncbi:AAA family ATPase [Tessaracoccus coleopterorum]|uniref:AAA family ATPase n=1 Tax=Tessaracoccus coleopterorum TaxID=2714950 RepID=UPI002F912358
MLTTLRLTAFGVVEEAELELGAGLTALTGETGAGKTMIVSGLGHLLGARADAGVVRRGSDKAVVEGRWELPTELADRVTGLGGTVEEGEVVALRQVAATGRSRAVVGGAGVPVSTLGDLLSELATIHGQSGQIRLSTQERQRELLDAKAAPQNCRATSPILRSAAPRQRSSRSSRRRRRPGPARQTCSATASARSRPWRRSRARTRRSPPSSPG